VLAAREVAAIGGMLTGWVTAVPSWYASSRADALAQDAWIVPDGLLASGGPNGPERGGRRVLIGAERPGAGPAGSGPCGTGVSGPGRGALHVLGTLDVRGTTTRSKQDDPAAPGHARRPA